MDDQEQAIKEIPLASLLSTSEQTIDQGVSKQL
jgi:hypothetical protein